MDGDGIEDARYPQSRRAAALEEFRALGVSVRRVWGRDDFEAGSVSALRSK